MSIQNSFRNELDIMINLAGGTQVCADMMGILQPTLYDFRARGLTPIGVLLVERSRWLSKFFNREFLRPDLKNSQIDKFVNHKVFLSACAKQDDFEATENAIANTPIEFVLNLKK